MACIDIPLPVLRIVLIALALIALALTDGCTDSMHTMDGITSSTNSITNSMHTEYRIHYPLTPLIALTG